MKPIPQPPSTKPKVVILCAKCAYQATGQRGDAMLDALADHITYFHAGVA